MQTYTTDFTCSCEVWKKIEQKHVHDLIKL